MHPSCFVVFALSLSFLFVVVLVAASSTGENTVGLHRRVSDKRLVRRQPLFEKPRIDDVGDLVAALVVGVAETEVVEDEAEALVAAVVVAALVEDGAVLPKTDSDRHRANMDHDKIRMETILQPCRESFPFSPRIIVEEEKLMQ